MPRTKVTDTPVEPLPDSVLLAIKKETELTEQELSESTRELHEQLNLLRTVLQRISFQQQRLGHSRTRLLAALGNSNMTTLAINTRVVEELLLAYKELEGILSILRLPSDLSLWELLNNGSYTNVLKER